MSRSGPRRALGPPDRRVPWRAALALALAVVLGFGGYGSWAYWQDTAAVQTGQFQSGSLDLQLDTDAAVGLGTGYPKSSLTWSSLVPGEQVAFPLLVRNVGNPPVTYSGEVRRGTSPTWTYDGASITFQVFTGTPVAGTAYPRVDSCTGSSVGSRVLVPAADQAALSSARPLAADAAEPLCLVVGLDQGSANVNQAKTGSIVFTLTAQQVTG